MATVNEQLESWTGRNELARRIFGMPADTHRGWSISFDYPPIPCRDFDWSATSPDYDCDGDSEGFHQTGGYVVHGRTRGDVIEAIDEHLAGEA